MTYFGAYRNRENLIRFNNYQAAVNYAEEFSQLWLGIHNQANSADNYFSINNTPVDIHFSPDDDFRQTRLLPLLQSARESVHIMAFAFTSQAIADELVALERRGVDVKVVVDKGQSGQSSSQYNDLLALNLNIRRDGQSFRLHHKVIIVDGRYTVTGSYNFSENAESRNDENSVVLDDSGIAQSFEQEFSDIYGRSVAKPAPKGLVEAKAY
jgi:phosphatidylserine/phosphatidylglycerophosphate/cardiolipin synthase-like enzyme